MQTVRLDILSTSPLDGTTVFDLSAASIRTKDGQSQDAPFFGEVASFILVATLPAANDFGIFDPGELVGGRNKNKRLVSLTVIPSVAQAFAQGDTLELVGPAGQRTALVDLSRANGIYGGLDVVVPVNHTLAFNTISGAAAGPYRIDMTFLDIENPSEFFGREV